jgi:hypothetical protein
MTSRRGIDGDDEDYEGNDAGPYEATLAAMMLMTMAATHASMTSRWRQ